MSRLVACLIIFDIADCNPGCFSFPANQANRSLSLRDSDGSEIDKRLTGNFEANLRPANIGNDLAFDDKAA
ncbi:hypothetical protein GCM10010525_04540 [Glutamicibacter bergerei]